MASSPILRARLSALINGVLPSFKVTTGVESVTGKPWDSDDWDVSMEQWDIICQKVNGTYGDETRLEGKTRADIPENRQALLRFLEQKGWLYEQFK